MQPYRIHQSRRGTVLVEVALIAPVVMLLVLGQVAGGIAVFRLHQVAALANEGARWASVHGPRHARKHHVNVPGTEEVLEHAIKPLATSMNLEKLQCKVHWNEDLTTVAVTVSYRWLANFMGREFTVSGYSELPVSN